MNLYLLSTDLDPNLVTVDIAWGGVTGHSVSSILRYTTWIFFRFGPWYRLASGNLVC
jgi:hypothetical protein